MAQKLLIFLMDSGTIRVTYQNQQEFIIMESLSLPALQAGEYAGGVWYYEPHTYQNYRYVLGRVGPP